MKYNFISLVTIIGVFLGHNKLVAQNDLNPDIANETEQQKEDYFLLEVSVNYFDSRVQLTTIDQPNPQRSLELLMTFHLRHITLNGEEFDNYEEEGLSVYHATNNYSLTIPGMAQTLVRKTVRDGLKNLQEALDNEEMQHIQQDIGTYTKSGNRLLRLNPVGTVILSMPDLYVNRRHPLNISDMISEAVRTEASNFRFVVIDDGVMNHYFKRNRTPSCRDNRFLQSLINSLIGVCRAHYFYIPLLVFLSLLL